MTRNNVCHCSVEEPATLCSVCHKPFDNPADSHNRIKINTKNKKWKKWQSSRLFFPSIVNHLLKYLPCAITLRWQNLTDMSTEVGCLGQRPHYVTNNLDNFPEGKSTWKHVRDDSCHWKSLIGKRGMPKKLGILHLDTPLEKPWREEQ